MASPSNSDDNLGMPSEQCIGLMIGVNFRLVAVIGSGSYGCVFEAEELTAGVYISRVAVKIIMPRTDDERALILREIRGLARLGHEHVIAYRSSGEIETGPLQGAIYLVTELAETTLDRLLLNVGNLPDEELKEVILGMARALAHCHRNCAIHRDVKPANIFRVQGRWKLGDFGLVESIQSSADAGSGGGGQGSLAYLAPEALDGQFSPSTDIYALGMTVLECITGKVAFECTDVDEFRERLKTQPAVVPAEVPLHWRELIAQCLAR